MPMDIFEDKIVKKLRKQKSGDTLALVYVKLYLEALKSDGLLKFEKVEKTLEEELALLLGERVEDVCVVLTIMVCTGRAEKREDGSVMVDIEGNGARTERNEEPPKKKYGAYKNVLLTDAEVEELKKEVPNYKGIIDEMSEYQAMNGKDYKNHFAAIKKWAKDGKKRPPIKITDYANYEQRSYDEKEIERIVKEKAQ